MSSEVLTTTIDLVNQNWNDRADQVARELAYNQFDIDVLDDDLASEFIRDGISEAINEIDGKTYEDASDAIRTAIYQEMQKQAKQMALRLLRELAAKARTSDTQAAEAVVA